MIIKNKSLGDVLCLQLIKSFGLIMLILKENQQDLSLVVCFVQCVDYTAIWYDSFWVDFNCNFQHCATSSLLSGRTW